MVQIFFATNRDVKYETSKNSNNFGTRFNEAGPQLFRLGKTDVKLTGDPLDDNAWEVGHTELYPEVLDSRRKEGAKLGSAAMFADLREILKEKQKDVIIYLHGFANDFVNTAKRTAALEHLYGEGGKSAVVVAFSWPSNGKVFGSYNYHSDRDDASLSGVAMARVLAKLVDFLQKLRAEDRQTMIDAQREGRVPTDDELQQCNRSIHIVAHSMGNWALRHAINRFAEINEGRVPRIVDHCFLMAADDDADTLRDEHKMAKLLRLANYIHVYHARDDRALQISDSTKGNPNRLGAHGPENLDLLDERVMAIDCRDVSDTAPDHGRHQYYRLRKEVITDVVATLAGRPQDGRTNRVATRPGRSWRILSGKTA
ncbi:alpha/beta hydrolase [Algicella marina]|uniref:Alpha/beta fold hydrolase n=1 Tax=Algicella marina TaxID=2683284 RepID=A0A6P1SY94_9RHOB|nr:alpha/beta hydrolase [Algicella marina]QHQ34461.1 alpha/beta fold hydrolase [Algicella marina]